MRRSVLRMLVWFGPACAATAFLVAVAGAEDEASAVFGVRLPSGYRTWQVVSVAHEAGDLNDIRAILANDVAMKTFKDGSRPFPDGAIIVRLAWQYVPAADDNAAFGKEQSFVAGPPTNIQVSVKDSRRYATTGGWGFGQFTSDGQPSRSEALLNTCAPCHARAPRASDFVFTHYAP